MDALRPGLVRRQNHRSTKLSKLRQLTPAGGDQVEPMLGDVFRIRLLPWVAKRAWMFQRAEYSILSDELYEDHLLLSLY
jgi:hypothetical protein